MSKSKYKIPHYCNIFIEGRQSKNEDWGLRNALKDENAAVFGGEMKKEKLLERAKHLAEEWRRNYPGSETRVVVTGG